MISERALKGQTDILYFGTSLAPPNVIPSDSLALLLLHWSRCIHFTAYTFPPKRFDIFFPRTGGCLEGIGAFSFLFLYLQPLIPPNRFDNFSPDRRMLRKYRLVFLYTQTNMDWPPWSRYSP